MVETFIIALATLLVALYVQARRAAREIRARTQGQTQLVRIVTRR